MSKLPVATPLTPGRIFGTDWSIANVATLLRAKANGGAWRRADTTGGYLEKVNEHYLRTVSARHLPTQVSVIFARVEPDGCFYASLCFVNDEGHLPWNAEVAELWLNALAGEHRPRLVEQAGESEQPAHQFTLG